ncbi:MAG TPA: hypothetical protein VLG11_05095 [Candidatus Saccharimonadales bacterium]|nr:hypothetical protein [Candidatus Saccharimonadales bacterium]
MAYETELLPPDTSLYWHSETGNLACITQRGGALFFNYDTLFYRDRNDIRKSLEPRRGAHLACYLIGLTSAEAAKYLGEAEEFMVRNSMRTLYKQLGSRGHKPEHTGQRLALYALGQLAQRDVVRLGRKPTPTDKYTPMVCNIVEGYLQRQNHQEIAGHYKTTPNAITEQMKYWRRQAGFPNVETYALHLFMAGLVGDVTYRPGLMGMAPSLSPVPPQGVAPVEQS